MSKDKREKKHFMDESIRGRRDLRKPMPKPGRPMRNKMDEEYDEKWDWKQALDKLDEPDDRDDIGDIEIQKDE